MWPSRRPRSMKNCVPDPLVPRALSSSWTVASRRPGRSGCRTPTGQACRPGWAIPCAPMARTLLDPPCTSALVTAQSRSRSITRSIAHPLPMAPGFNSTPGRVNRTRLPAASSSTHCMPAASRARASSSAVGVRPWRRRNPQVLTNEPAAMSNAPPVRSWRFRASSNSAKRSASTGCQPSAAAALRRASSLVSR